MVMPGITSKWEQLTGQTPLYEMKRLMARVDAGARLLFKLEYFNPAGSVKDRAALSMINDSERRGLLLPGGTIIEPTSGNTGIGLAALGAARGYHVILTMPDTMSMERRKLLKAYGAQLVLTPGKAGMQGAVDKAEELHKTIPGSIIAGQFNNPANPKAHYVTTGPEIWTQCNSKVDWFVAGIGTGGTISGAGAYLKEQNPNLNVLGIEPAASPLISKGHSGTHGLQGIGANFIPGNFHREVCSEMMTVTEEQAYETAHLIAQLEGILVGITSGAAAYGAIQLAKRPENRGKTIVTLLPDGGDKYLSTPLF